MVWLNQGVKPGDRVATLLKNGIEFVETYFAAAKIGAILVPVNWRLVANEISYILNDSGAVALVYDDDLLFIMYTSGTTIGINDLSRNSARQGVDIATANYPKLIDLIDEKLPHTRVYIQSVLPVNNTWPCKYPLIRSTSPSNAINIYPFKFIAKGAHHRQPSYRCPSYSSKPPKQNTVQRPPLRRGARYVSRQPAQRYGAKSLRC